MILLVVDTQKGCFDERLYAFETVRNNIKQLITIARENNVEVVYFNMMTARAQSLIRLRTTMRYMRNLRREKMKGDLRRM